MAPLLGRFATPSRFCTQLHRGLHIIAFHVTVAPVSRRFAVSEPSYLPVRTTSSMVPFRMKSHDGQHQNHRQGKRQLAQHQDLPPMPGAPSSRSQRKPTVKIRNRLLLVRAILPLPVRG